MNKDPQRGPLVSMVIEWDKVRLSELARARRMCRALFVQIERLREGRVIEVFFLSDALAIDPAFRDEGAAAPGVSFARGAWPHGESGPAKPHGSVFAR